MSSDSRRTHRRNVHEPVMVVDTMTEEIIGRLGNLSESGMLLVANAALVEDALYQLGLGITDNTGRSVSIVVGAHLLWVGSANTPGQSWAGARCLTIEESQLAVLRQWIARPAARG
ncbi:MAG: PilZ domain-containing protein [Pseudoxanthomonas sp.]